MNRILIAIPLILGFLMGCYNQEEKLDKSKLTGNDYRSFQGTPAWALAKAVKAEDVDGVRKEVLKNKIDPNYQDAKFGNTLLMLAIVNGHYRSVKELLSLGTDPNLQDKNRGTNSVIDAAENGDPKYLALLLAYKGNPNSIEKSSGNGDDRPRQTALTSAISYADFNSLKKVKLLVEAGANMDYPEEKESYIALPLGVALTQDRMDVAIYLLLQGANYNRILCHTIDGKPVYVLQALRKSILDLNSPEYQKKLEIITFLKGRGLDYANEPIPDYVLKNIKKKYPDSWQEYIEKY